MNDNKDNECKIIIDFDTGQFIAENGMWFINNIFHWPLDAKGASMAAAWINEIFAKNDTQKSEIEMNKTII